jgi:MOSC domain-containing protein YiiM
MRSIILASIQVGLPRELPPTEEDDLSNKSWTTAFFKQPIDRTFARRTGLEGDRQADQVNHGGFDKAICVYSLTHYPYWQEILEVDPLPGGAFGENFSLDSIDEAGICIGDSWQVGESLVVQVSQPRQPCWKLARRWQRKSLTLEVQDSGKTGWYFRVLQEGEVRAGSKLKLLDRPHSDWTVARANLVMHHEKDNVALATELAALAELSESWRNSLQRRLRN